MSTQTAGGYFLSRTYLSRRPRAEAWFPVILALGLMFGLSALHWTDWPIAAHLAGSRDAIFSSGEVYRLLTGAWVHADLGHLLSNAGFFAGLGFLLHSYFGGWAFPILPLVLGVITQAVTLYIYPPGSTLVGASGMVYAMAGMWLALYLGIERKHSLIRRVVNVVGLSAMLLAPSAFDPRVSYAAHAVGYGLGIVTGLGVFWRRKEELRSFEEYRLREVPEEHELGLGDEVRAEPAEAELDTDAPHEGQDPTGLRPGVLYLYPRPKMAAASNLKVVETSTDELFRNHENHGELHACSSRSGPLPPSCA